MQLRTFTAESSARVLAQIREELGPDAVILDTREKDGLVTVTAALERDLPASVTASGPVSARASERAAGQSARRSGERAYAQADAVPPGWRQWHQEWDSIRMHLLSLTKSSLNLNALSPKQRVAIDFLQRQGIDDEATLAIVSRLQGKAEASILEPLADLVPVKPLGKKHWRERIQIVTGPFGAGKTSVAIRMALRLRAETPKMTICLINADATRGNGRLLLRHYSNLSEFAYKEAASALELVEAVTKAKGEGFGKIIIDLPGLGKGATLQALLADCALQDEDAAVHLVLPPHYSALELRTLLGRYKASLAGSIIWTKLDEAEHYGPLVNVAVQTGLPVSALSYGPGMGNSLAEAKETALWRLIFKSELPDNE